MSRLDVPSSLKAQASLRRASAFRPPDGPSFDIPPVPTAANSRKPPRRPQAVGNGVDRRKSRVDGMLQRKRQSISFHSQEAFRAAHQNEPIPAMPPLPTGLGPAQQAHQVDLDMDDIASETFSPQEYIASYLAANPRKTKADALQSLKASVTAASDRMASDLQQSVLSNYAHFVTISKELSALETEMLELKGVLEEWRSVPDSLELSTEADMGLGSALTTSGSKRGARNSIADLALVYRNQLESLWESVEGSQTLLPPIPNRRIMAETSAFTELNAATYKPRGPVHLFVLNDALLVAIRKRRQMGSKVKLVADKCFSLNEIVVVDLKDGGELQHAVKIKRSKEVFIFCAERAEDKRGLLATFKKVAEEMLSKKRKQAVWEAENRRDMDVGPPPLPSAASPLGAFDPIQHFGLDETSTGKDNSWIDDVSDDLAERIAMREFERAVALVEQGKAAVPSLKSDPAVLNLFKDKIDARSAELTAGLLKDIHSSALHKTSAVQVAGWLQRLDGTDQAREAFLDGRSALVKRRVKQIKFQGDIEAYIGELSIVVFTLIKTTCDWYIAAFRDSKLASGFVQWATQQVELFSSIFMRQVQGHERQVTDRCLALTTTHAMILRDVGLDFGYMLQQATKNPELQGRPQAL